MAYSWRELSPPQRPLCFVGNSRPPHLLFFSIIAIFIEIPSGSLYGGESGGSVPPSSPNPDPISDQRM